MGTLRIILATAVVIVHSTPIYGWKLMGGPVAVQVFYIISGFFMTMILNENYNAPGSYKLFIKKRFMRIFPLYWVIALLALILSAIAYCFFDVAGCLASYSHPLSPVSLVVLIASNIAIFGQDIMMFLGLNNAGDFFFTSNFWQTDPKVYQFLLVPQAWFLSLLLMFYLLAPFLVRRRLITVVLIIIASLGLRVYIYYGLHWRHDPWNYRFFPTELALFMAGYLSYQILKLICESIIHPKIPMVAGIGFLLITVAYQFLPGVPILGRKWPFLIAATLAIPFLFIWSKHSRMDRYIGELAFPVYLCHVFIIGIFELLGIPAKGLYIIIASVLFSIALMHLVIRPIDIFCQNRILKQA